MNTPLHGLLRDFVVMLCYDTICPHTAEAPTVAAAAWSWVTAKFYKPAGQPEEGTPDEQLREQKTEPSVQEGESRSGVHIVVCGECV